MSKRLTAGLIRNRIRQLNERIDLAIVSGRGDQPKTRELMREHKTLFLQLQKLSWHRK